MRADRCGRGWPDSDLLGRSERGSPGCSGDAKRVSGEQKMKLWTETRFLDFERDRAPVFQWLWREVGGYGRGAKIFHMQILGASNGNAGPWEQSELRSSPEALSLAPARPSVVPLQVVFSSSSHHSEYHHWNPRSDSVSVCNESLNLR